MTRVLLLLNYLAGGAAESTLEIAKCLQREGYVVTVGHLFGWDQLAYKYEEAGIPLLHINGAKPAQALAALRHTLKLEHYDVVHTQAPYAGIVGRLASRLVGVPTIISSQRLSENAYSIPTRAVDQFTFPLADRVICVSEGVRKSLPLARFILPKRLVVIHNGIDIEYVDTISRSTNRHEIRQELGLPIHCPLVCNVGRLRPTKGHGYLLRAMRDVIFHVSDALLVIVGGGKDRRDECELYQAIEQLGLTDRVMLTGWKPRQEALSILSASDVCVVSSTHEGFSRVILEAMALQKPIVATDILGVREAIDDQVNGLLVPPGSPGELAIAIVAILSEPEYGQRLGKNARGKVERRFTLRHTERAHLTLYQQLLRK